MADIGITRDEAWALLNERVKNENLVKHCLATEAIMRALAERLGEEPDVWGLAGLVHDLDFEETSDSPTTHALITAEELERRGVDQAVIQAIKEHNAEALGLERASKFGIALACSETITGLIVATALVYPDKKVASVKAKSVRKRMKEKAFARQVNRETIMECEKLGLSLDELIPLSLSAMAGIADQLGL